MLAETSAEFLTLAAEVKQNATAELFEEPKKPWSQDALEILEDNRHLNALSKVLRWLGSDIRITLLDFKESNKDHVLDMRKIYEEEMSQKYPSLYAELDRRTTLIMILGHDSAETRTGDLPLTNGDPALRARKKIREKLAIKAFLHYISKISQPAALELFEVSERYESKDEYEDDKEAQCTKFLDCAQSSRVALRHGLYNTIASPKKKSAHVQKALKDLVIWGIRLRNSVEKPQSKEEAERWLAEEVSRYIAAGFEEDTIQVINACIEQKTIF